MPSINLEQALHTNQISSDLYRNYMHYIQTARALLIVCEHTDANEFCRSCCLCGTCCHCVTCARCDRKTTTVCTSCSNCKRCCKCINCITCGTLTKDYHAACKRCKEHCTCYTCLYCKRVSPHLPTCRSCHNCNDHCLCHVCDTCYSRYNCESYCHACYNCSGCCCCRRGGIRFVDRHVTFFDGGINRKINKSKRFIAIELEIASCASGKDIWKATDKWKCSIVRDGSLPSTGFEINSSPASGDLFLNQMSDLINALHRQDAVIDNTCGMHVHVDARNFSYYDIKRLILLYSYIEDGLFKLVPPARKSSRFCRPCSSLYLSWLEKDFKPKKFMKGKRLVRKKNKSNIINSVYGNTDTYRRNNERKYYDARYYALNLHSWFMRGTIECRMFNGTVNYEKVVNWGMLWAGIVDWAYSHSENEILSLPKDPIDALITIAPNASIAKWIYERYNYLFRLYNRGLETGEVIDYEDYC